MRTLCLVSFLLSMTYLCVVPAYSPSEEISATCVYTAHQLCVCRLRRHADFSVSQRRLVCSITCLTSRMERLAPAVYICVWIPVYTLMYGVSKSCIDGAWLLMCGEKTQASFSLFNKVCAFCVPSYSFAFCFLLPFRCRLDDSGSLFCCLPAPPWQRARTYTKRKDRSRRVLSAYSLVSVHLSICIHIYALSCHRHLLNVLSRPWGVVTSLQTWVNSLALPRSYVFLSSLLAFCFSCLSFSFQLCSSRGLLCLF